jgi:hypothetical protein
MSTSPDSAQRADDRIVTLLSQWLVGTLGNDALRKEVESVDRNELAPGARAALGELVDQLRDAIPGERANLQVAVRETLEAIAYGD